MLPSEPRTERPSYVEFEKKEVEDRDASMKEGRYMAKDIDYAIITPIGSKDRIPREWTAWYASLKQQAQEGRIPPDWPGHYLRAYQSWKAGQEVPLSGTPIKGWPVLSPAQQANIIGANIRTVEDLAQINEEAQRRIGMGALDFRDKAITYLKAAKGPGVLTTEMAALKGENTRLKTQLEAQGDQMKEMKEELKALQLRVGAKETV